MIEKSRLIFFISACLSICLWPQITHCHTDSSSKEGLRLIIKTISDNGRTLNILRSLGDTIPIWDRHLLGIESIDANKDFRQRQRYHFQEGDFLNVSLALTVAPYIGPASHVQISAGRRIRKKLSIGVGAGLDSYRSGIVYERYSYLSMFAQTRAYLYKKNLKRTKPFISAKLGYGFAENAFIRWHTQEGSHRGGLMFNPSVGLHFSPKGRPKF